MKYCIKCGAQLQDNTQFCIQCGTRCDQGASASAPSYNQTVVPVDFDAQPKTSPVSEQVARYFKQAATSPLAIAVAITYTVLFLMGLYSAFDPFVGMDAVEKNAFLRELAAIEYGPLLLKITKIIAYVTQIPTVLTVIGIWITVVSTLRSDRLHNAKGMRLITGVYQVLRIAYPLLLLVCSVLVITACSATSDVYWLQEVRTFRTICSILLLAFWIAGGLSLWFYSKIVSTMRSLSDCIASSTPFAEISMVVVVLCFISGGLSALSIFGSANLFSFFSNALSAACMIMAGIVLLKLRDNLSRLASVAYYERKRQQEAQSYQGGVFVAADTHDRWECKNCYCTNPSTFESCVKCGFRKDG